MAGTSPAMTKRDADNGCHELRRIERNDNFCIWLRQTNPTGKSPNSCPVLPAKIFRLTRRANQN